MTRRRPAASAHDGLWTAGLGRRTKSGSAEPLCLDCHDEPIEIPPAPELTLLWRRGKRFRRHRTYR
ncbi:MAG TPA: hypothetical protein VHC63_00690 [Acidimicrobiales bacterium]|nr:hypothetical protein [Acidimicrobiales bacterium]